jgi:two-component system phosphate regulon sensor histidine kinase PhoR
MTSTSKKFIVGILLFLATGTAIGWIYGQPLIGLLVFSLLALVWQIRQLVIFDRALRTNKFDDFRVGEGIWEQIFSRFQFERDRATRRKENYRRLLKEIRKSTNAMPDGAVILDANNEIVASNRAAKELAGLKRKKDKGQRIENILRDPQIIKLLSSEGYDRAIEISSPVIDGDWLSCRVVPYGADQKLLLLQDVTERIRLNKMRRDFVANASHELRSPLTVISGYLDGLAEDDDVPESWSRPMEQMRNQAGRMGQILGEMLELSRLESSGSAATDEAIDMVELLNQVQRDFQGPDTASVVLNDESTAQLLGVRSEIESVVVNLLSNAIRHTPQAGEITLTWRTGPDGAELIVQDTGEGIDEEDIPRLTERFFRVDRGRSRSKGGVGLGLAIVKHVLARHDADISIASQLESGSTFTCHFPPARVSLAAPAAMS